MLRMGRMCSVYFVRAGLILTLVVLFVVLIVLICICGDIVQLMIITEMARQDALMGH